MLLPKAYQLTGVRALISSPCVSSGVMARESMSKRTGSLSPCKLQQHPGLWHLGNRDNNRRRATAENPSHPFPGHYYASPALAAHYRQRTHSE